MRWQYLRSCLALLANKNIISMHIIHLAECRRASKRERGIKRTGTFIKYETVTAVGDGAIY